VERGCLGGVFVVDSHWRLILENNRGGCGGRPNFLLTPSVPLEKGEVRAKSPLLKGDLGGLVHGAQLCALFLSARADGQTATGNRFFRAK